MQSPEGNQLWYPSQSLWSLITEHVPESELPKIRTALGHSLVDMYTDLHSEAEIWHKIWQSSQQGNNSSSAGTPLPRQQGSPLADPPAVKELVRAEVKMLLQTLKERASRGGSDGEALMFRYKPETVDYALGHLDSCYRNHTSCEDTDDWSRPSSHCSVRSTAEDEVEAMRSKLNITDIDQVVDRLKSVLTEECEALSRLVEHFKGNLKQRCQSQCDPSEPTLAELKELRGVIQKDLELYPSSFDASPPAPSSLPLKELRNRFRLSAGQSVSDETLQTLSPTSVPLRPHPPPPLCHPKPRPPLSAPPSRNSSSVRLINSPSLSQTHGQRRSTSASAGPRKTQTICNSSGLMNRHFTPSPPRPASDQIMVNSTHRCSLFSEEDSADLHCRTPSPNFQIKTPRIAAVHETHLSCHRSIQSPSRERDLSPQTERKSSPAWRSRNINTITSSTDCEAGSDCSDSADHSVSTTGKPKTQNSTCGGSLMSTTAQADNDRKKSTESFYPHAGSRRSHNGPDRNKNGHFRKEQSLVATV
ncbi:Coiled-coil domain-containing protein 24 [Larimichthys crocea]|uniref:Uncharacterized protein n=1 Tax=Larimichthys crocea TaxID=215358 RepID=A0ACD3QRH8_LARCR|nr:Coiled-coil domain-containing protein 24 [Larimichthys crocea]